MPELPEVESLRLYLAGEDLVGRTITDVSADLSGIDKATNPLGRLSRLRNRRIKNFSRTGKNLFVHLDRGALWLHMGMTGRLSVMYPHEEPQRFTRVTFFLDDERRIELEDPRRWARVRYEESSAPELRNVGPDALDAGMSVAEFVDRVKCRRSPVKSVLMDQAVLSGIGNIYADEALHRAGIHPARRANRISAERLSRLHRAIRVTLLQALRYIVDHPDDRGRPYVVDAYDDRMRLHRRKGSTCPDCGTILSTRRFGGRTAYFCSNCQI